MLDEQKKELARHCVKLVQEKDHYTKEQWDQAMQQLELACGPEIRRGSHTLKPKSRFLENSCPIDRD